MHQNIERDVKRIENLNQRLKSGAEEVRKAMAALSARLDAQSDDGRLLLGRVEELQHTAQLATDDLVSIKEFLDRKLGFTMVKLPPDTPKEPTALFEFATRKLKQKKLPLARVLMQKFVEAYPKHDRVLAARLSIGETYRLQRRFRDALKVYFRVYEPWEGRESKAPPEAAEALWLAGQALLDSGDCAKAVAMYKLLIRSFRKADRAAKAKEKVATLKCN